MRSFVFLINHEQFLAGQDRSLHRDQSAVRIDLDDAGTFVERVIARVGVHE